MTVNAPRYETQIAYHRRRAEELKSLRNPMESEWTDLSSFIDPTRVRLQTRDDRSVSRKNIVDSTGTFAYQTIQSGMHSGLTSPARPWFRLTTYDPGMKDFAPIKTYLSDVERRMREVFQSSNIYNAFHSGYGDISLLGQSCGLLAEHDTQTIRMMQLLHGQFWIARDETGRATTLYRRFRWSVQRIVSRFGTTKVSDRVRQAYDNGKYDDRFDIWHAVEPRLNRDASKIDKANKPFLSNYWEEGGNENDLLEESGFDENPIIAPAWEIAGEDHYASKCPGMVALSDVKMLQKEQTRKLEGIDKKVRPPMTGPTSMRNNPASLLPGSITYSDTNGANGGYRPAMEVRLDLRELQEDIRSVQDRINRAFYADLFLMLANMEGIQPRNQFEIAERKEEKLLALGPVLENIYNGQLQPVIDRTYAIMNRNNMLPPPPADLQGVELKIEYISMLAQAQKAVATGSIERLWGFAGQLAGVKPDILDKLDADQSIDEYADALGVTPSIVVPDEDVKGVRAARAKQQQAAANAELAATVAPAAKAGADAAAVLATAQDNSSGPALLEQLGIG